MNNEYFSQLRDQNILITGGCGFIGLEVTILDNLSSGKKEYVQDFPNVTLVEGNITDEKI